VRKVSNKIRGFEANESFARKYTRKSSENFSGKHRLSQSFTHQDAYDSKNAMPLRKTMKFSKQPTIKLIEKFPQFNMWEGDTILNETLDICQNILSSKNKVKNKILIENYEEILNNSFPSLTLKCEKFISEPFKDIKNNSIKSIACNLLKNSNLTFNYEIYEEKKVSFKSKAKAIYLRRNTIFEEISNEMDSEDKINQNDSKFLLANKNLQSAKNVNKLIGSDKNLVNIINSNNEKKQSNFQSEKNVSNAFKFLKSDKKITNLENNTNNDINNNTNNNNSNNVSDKKVVNVKRLLSDKISNSINYEKKSSEEDDSEIQNEILNNYIKGIEAKNIPISALSSDKKMQEIRTSEESSVNIPNEDELLDNYLKTIEKNKNANNNDNEHNNYGYNLSNLSKSKQLINKFQIVSPNRMIDNIESNNTIDEVTCEISKINTVINHMNKKSNTLSYNNANPTDKSVNIVNNNHNLTTNNHINHINHSHSNIINNKVFNSPSPRSPAVTSLFSNKNNIEVNPNINLKSCLSSKKSSKISIILVNNEDDEVPQMIIHKDLIKRVYKIYRTQNNINKSTTRKEATENEDNDKTNDIKKLKYDLQEEKVNVIKLSTDRISNNEDMEENNDNSNDNNVKNTLLNPILQNTLFNNKIKEMESASFVNFFSKLRNQTFDFSQLKNLQNIGSNLTESDRSVFKSYRDFNLSVHNCNSDLSKYLIFNNFLLFNY